MAVHTPVVGMGDEHTPLPDSDKIAGSTIQISGDGGNTLSVGSDGGLIVTPKGAWNKRLRPDASGTYDVGLLDGTTGEYSAGFVSLYAPDNSNVIYTLDISTIPLEGLFMDGDPLSTLLAEYKVTLIITWGTNATVTLQFSGPVYLPGGGISATWRCRTTPMDGSTGVTLDSNFYELYPVYDATRPILKRLR